MAKAKAKIVAPSDEGVTIPKGQVIVIGTGAIKYLKAGKEYTVNSIHAATLIKKGSATLKQ